MSSNKDLGEDVLGEESVEKDTTKTPTSPTADSQQTPVVPVYSESTTPTKNITLPVPNTFTSDATREAAISELRSALKDTDNAEASIALLEDITSSFVSISSGGYRHSEFVNTLNRGTQGQKVIDAEGKGIRIKHPKYKASHDNDELSGPEAFKYISGMVGVGNVTIIPLWHSGLVITLDSFRERKLLTLSLDIARHRIGLGSATRGASFTGDDVYIVGTIVDFILSHVIDCNLKGWRMDKLKALILVNDIPALLAGALSGIYPSGYPIAHSCINSGTSKCNYTSELKRKDNGDYEPDGLLDFSKVLWVDKSRLDNTAITHMSVTEQLYSNGDVKRYQTARTDNIPNGDDLIWQHPSGTGGIRVHFKIPSIKEYTVMSKNWISQVVAMVDSAMLLEADLDADELKAKRNQLMIDYSMTMDVVKHANWIGYITVIDPDGSERSVSGDDDINKSLEIFNEIEGFTDKFVSLAQQYKENSIFAFTGLPNFECPVCHEGQVDPNNARPTLIPINMVGYFFTILEWRTLMRGSNLA